MKRISLAVILMLSCATTREAQIPAPPAPPSWILRPPQDGDNLYFVGTVGNAERLEDAKAAAINQAFMQASQFIGVEIRGKDNVRESSDSLTASIKSRVRAKTMARVVNAEAVDWFVENRGKEINGVSLPLWRVAVLVRVPKEKLEAERQRQEKETQEQIEAAGRLYVEGRKAESKSETLAQALGVYARSKNLLVGIDRSARLAASTDGAKDVRALSDLVAEASARVLGRLRRVFLSTDTGSRDASFIGAMTAKLTESGFTVTANAEDSFFVLRGSSSASLAGTVMGKRCARAEASVEVRAQANPALVLTAVRMQAKGFDRDEHGAVRQAFQEVGTEAGGKVAEQLDNWITKTSGMKPDEKGDSHEQ